MLCVVQSKMADITSCSPSKQNKRLLLLLTQTRLLRTCEWLLFLQSSEKALEQSVFIWSYLVEIYM